MSQSSKAKQAEHVRRPAARPPTLVPICTIAVEHFVPLAVVGKRARHIGGPFSLLRGHAHSVRSARRI
jgi:hypothetical protein